MVFGHSLFGDSFTSAFPVEESVLDFPSGKKLCSDVWKEDSDGNYVLTDEADKKTKTIIEWVKDAIELENPKFRIVGSICSNTYNDKSDIDIHICADNIVKDNADEMNKKLMSAFKRKFVGNKNGELNGHPYEVYLQHNEHQDEMSVGCYDVTESKWISGPEILDSDFNPYEAYYDGIVKHLSDITDDIRNHTLKCGEVASVILKIVDKVGPNDKFLVRMENELSECTKEARRLFEDIRKKRSVASDPKSKRDALAKRDSKEWKIADSSFKFMDKLGYIAAILSIAKAGEESDISTKKLCEKVISSIHDNLFNKDRTGYADIDKD